ncbi:MAG: hypothetical protein AB7V42_08320 [Thermoleophilia bacterium]
MKGYHTKKISLPGGRVIEIVYFSDEAPADGTPAVTVHADDQPAAPHDAHIGAGGHESDMHICPSCDGELVYPLSWEERQGDLWRIERRCPNCEWRHAGDFTQEDVERFDDSLNDGTEELLVTLREFSRANMEQDVERLITALQLDLIEPIDF